MSEETKVEVLEELGEKYQKYLGIPRHLIPWYPTIDAEKCVGCQECVKFCHDTVYAFDAENRKVFVENKWHCQIYCESCTYACNVDAISFPDRREIKGIIRGLRAQYPPE